MDTPHPSPAPGDERTHTLPKRQKIFSVFLFAAMSVLTYSWRVSKPLRWLAGEIKTPPLSIEARREMGFLLRQLQEGENLSLPHSRPMPSVGKACHELRVNDENKTWRLFYFVDSDAIVILELLEKKTQKTTSATILKCRQRVKNYEEAKRHLKKSNS